MKQRKTLILTGCLGALFALAHVAPSQQTPPPAGQPQRRLPELQVLRANPAAAGADSGAADSPSIMRTTKAGSRCSTARRSTVGTAIRDSGA